MAVSLLRGKSLPSVGAERIMTQRNGWYMLSSHQFAHYAARRQT
jgi:hypothetical protein